MQENVFASGLSGEKRMLAKTLANVAKDISVLSVRCNCRSTSADHAYTAYVHKMLRNCLHKATLHRGRVLQLETELYRDRWTGLQSRFTQDGTRTGDYAHTTGQLCTTGGQPCIHVSWMLLVAAIYGKHSHRDSHSHALRSTSSRISHGVDTPAKPTYRSHERSGGEITSEST